LSSSAHRDTRYAPFVGRATPRAGQGGFAFMVVLVGLVLGSLTIYLENLNRVVSPAAQENKTREALAEAKEILIAWAAESEIEHNGPGHLPCPDNDNNSHGDGSACGPESRLGRFPWKTLNAPDLRDASGERLWYAVSPNFLNKPTIPVNSDTKGIFRITGATEIDEVIAIIFAPGPALPSQNRGTDEARKNPANYLEDTNFADNEFVSSFDDAVSNDRMTFITAADLYPAVERKVAERMRTNIAPVLHYYLEEWKKVSGDAGATLPFAAPFDPTANAPCGQLDTWRGSLPVGYCAGGLTATWSGRIRTSSTNCTEAIGANDTLATITCNVVLRGGDDDCDGDGTDDETIKATLNLEAGYRTLAMPIDPGEVDHTLPDKNKKGQTTVRLKSSTAKSKKLADGTIQIDYQGKYEVSECKQDEEYLTVKIDFPLHRADTLYAKMQFDAIDADGGLGSEEKKHRKRQVDPAWFFDNGWHRLTYYAASTEQLPDSSCDTCPGTLTVHRAQASDSTAVNALFMLAGTATLYTDELDQKKRQVRPNAALANYFEASNREVESPAFQQANVLRGVNDRIVTVCPAPLPGVIVPSGCRSTLSGSSGSSGGSGGSSGGSDGDDEEDD